MAKATINVFPVGLTEPHERLAWARKHAGFKSPKAAAGRYNWNVNTYKSTENGTRGLNRKKAKQYSDAFKVPASWLLTGEGVPARPLNPKEVMLLEKFRRIPEHLQSTILVTADSLVAADQNQPQEQKSTDRARS